MGFMNASVTLSGGPYPTIMRAVGKPNPYGITYFVDATNGSNSYDGLSPTSAFATVQFAFALMVAGDTMVIAPGTYTLTAALVPLANQTFIAGRIFPRKPTVILLSSAIADMVQVDVSGVSFIGIEFQAGDNTCDNLVDLADGAAVTGAQFDQCVFNGADKTSVVALNLNDATFACKNLNVTNCLFRDLTGTHINVGVLGFEYSYIVNNQFAIDVNSGTAIALADTSAFATGKGYVVAGNYFTGFDATADELAITVAGTENTTGAGIVTNNRSAYLTANSMTQDKLSLSEVNNYGGDAATGGTLWDPGT